MKSSIKNSNDSVSKPFPKFMYRHTTGEVVHFLRSGNGCRVHHPKGPSESKPYFRYSVYWGMKDFVDFEGEVVLSND